MHCARLCCRHAVFPGTVVPCWQATRLLHTFVPSSLQGCTLECDARGLPHLAAPLLTRAVSRPAPPPTPAAAEARPAPPPAAAAAAACEAPSCAVGQKRPAAAVASCAKEEAPAAKRLRAWRSAAEAAAGAGVLSVVETRIRVGLGARAGAG